MMNVFAKRRVLADPSIGQAPRLPGSASRNMRELWLSAGGDGENDAFCALFQKIKNIN